MSHYSDQREKQIMEEKSKKSHDLSFLEPEFLDFLQILENGAKKYERDNWLKLDGKRSSHKEMHDSMFHHLAESFAGLRRDHESGLDPLLHLVTRALMYYTRLQRDIIHPTDK